MLVVIQGEMVADSHTAAVFQLINTRHFGGALRITAPYGANRSKSDQQHLRDLYLSGRGAFALPPGDSWHERGRAVDIANWAAFPNLRTVMASYGFVRDTYEGWHYNDTGTYQLPKTAPASTPASPITEKRIKKMDLFYARGDRAPETYLVNIGTGLRSYVSNAAIVAAYKAAGGVVAVIPQVDFDSIPKAQGSR